MSKEKDFIDHKKANDTTSAWYYYLTSIDGKSAKCKKCSAVLKKLNPKRDDQSSKNCVIGNMFSIPNKTEIRNHIKLMIDRLNYTHEESTEEDRKIYQSTPTETQHDVDKSYKEKLQEEIEKSMKTLEPAIQKQTDLSTIIKNEMRIFESGGARGHHLEMAYQYLLTISPTSVEAERAFSAAGFISNKIRSRLGDDTLDALLFLRSYFQNSTE